MGLSNGDKGRNPDETRHLAARAAGGSDRKRRSFVSRGVSSGGDGGGSRYRAGVDDPGVHTPQLATGPTQQVRQMVQCGGTMYAVGSFNTIKRLSTYTRNNAFSFSATAPYAVTAWDPNVNGVVNSIAFNGSDCAPRLHRRQVHLGQQHGRQEHRRGGHDHRRGRHHVRPQRDRRRSRRCWRPTATSWWAGTSRRSTARADPYMTSLNPTTGQDDGFLHLSISGNYQFPGVATRPGCTTSR